MNRARPMNNQTRILTVGIAASFVAALSFGATSVSAHCDGMDGPVVKAAQKALETNNVNLVLIWVRKSDGEATSRSCLPSSASELQRSTSISALTRFILMVDQSSW